MKVQEALKAALSAIDLYDYTGTQAESELYAKAESLCKSALSDIEKGEPVCYILTSTLDKMKLAGTSYAHLHSCIGQQIKPSSEYTAFYTSPISKEWVSIHDDDINELSELAYKNGGWDIEFARAIEAKLKQLNAPEKG